jgi:hypothetical protein
LRQGRKARRDLLIVRLSELYFQECFLARSATRAKYLVDQKMLEQSEEILKNQQVMKLKT